MPNSISERLREPFPNITNMKGLKKEKDRTTRNILFLGDITVETDHFHNEVLEIYLDAVVELHTSP